MNVFNGVTCPPTFSYRCALDCLLTMPVGFNIDLTYGLKPSVSLARSSILFLVLFLFFISNVRLSDMVKDYR